MSSMEYDDAAADRLEAVYLGPDIVAQRKDTLRRLDIQKGESVLDIGSGPGFLASDLADSTGPNGLVLGVDFSEQMTRRAASRNDRSWLQFQQGDAASLPCDSACFDVVVSTQVAEYVADIDAYCSEVFRVLKPGGRGVILATDWDAICWHSSDPDRMDRVLAAFAPHCANSRLPRTLGAKLRAAGLKLTDVGYFPIVNLDHYQGCYSEMMIPFIMAYVRSQAAMADEELSEWAQDLSDLNARGEHFFSTGRFIFELAKPD